jgi:hypothetical protein
MKEHDWNTIDKKWTIMTDVHSLQHRNISGTAFLLPILDTRPCIRRHVYFGPPHACSATAFSACHSVRTSAVAISRKTSKATWQLGQSANLEEGGGQDANGKEQQLQTEST